MQCHICRAQVQDGVTECPECGASLTINRTSTVNQPTDEFGKMFMDATNIWKANLGDLVILSLVLMLVVWIPFANAGFITGYYRSVLRVFRGQGKAQAGDLFNAWDCFAQMLILLVVSFIAMILLSLIPLIGTLAGMALGVLMAPALFAVADRGMNAVDSVKWGIETIKKDPINWLLAGLVGSIITSVGAIALLIGVIVTMPWGTLITAAQYERRKND